MPTDRNQIEGLLAAYAQGSYAEAEHRARAMLADRPDDLLAGNTLGSALLGLQRFAESAVVFSRLTYQYPHDALLWNNLGAAQQRCGQLQEAEQSFVRALQLQPEDARFIANLGFLQIERRRIVRAKDLLQKAVRIDPENFEARIYAALACLDCGESPAAEDLLKDWRQWVTRINVALQVELAGAMLRLYRDADAEELLRANLDDARSGWSARARLAVTLERLNRLEEAHNLLATLPEPEGVSDDPELRSEIIEAHAALAARGKDANTARGLLERLLRGSGPDRGYSATCFALAKVCDRQDDVHACMNYLEQAHARQMEVARQLIPDLVQPESSPLSIADFPVTREQFQAWGKVDVPTAEESPIFIVGFPRSGTTMLEQMLDAHPGMISMDERPFVQRVIDRMQAAGLQYPEDLERLDARRCSELREVYWAAVEKVTGQGRRGKRLVDKNPLTMLRLPMLVRLFPNAKIIFALRHPCDVLLSCYMQNFNAPPFMALCSTLQRLASGYVKAMNFWASHVELMKPDLFEWRYECAMEHFDSNVERLGSFLELGSSAPLRDFSDHARRKGFISTPSYSQVVQPVYTTSIGRWHRYRRWFEPVLPALVPVLQRWGYDD